MMRPANFSLRKRFGVAIRAARPRLLLCGGHSAVFNEMFARARLVITLQCTDAQAAYQHHSSITASTFHLFFFTLTLC